MVDEDTDVADTLKGGGAMEYTVEDLLPIVRNMAGGLHARLHYLGLELEELVGDGSLGLVKAFNADRKGHSAPFRAFAIFMIRREMWQGINRNRMKKREQMRDEEANDHKDRKGFMPKSGRPQMLSLETPVSSETNTTYADRLADERNYDPFQRILFRELMEVVAKTRPIDQQRIQLLMEDTNKIEAKQYDKKERAKMRSVRYLTVKKIRKLVGEQ